MHHLLLILLLGFCALKKKKKDVGADFLTFLRNSFMVFDILFTFILLLCYSAYGIRFCKGLEANSKSMA